MTGEQAPTKATATCFTNSSGPSRRHLPNSGLKHVNIVTRNVGAVYDILGGQHQPLPLPFVSLLNFVFLLACGLIQGADLEFFLL